jgi:hypothetical protein
MEGAFAKLMKEPSANGMTLKEVSCLFFTAITVEDDFAVFLLPPQRNKKDRVNDFKAVLVPKSRWVEFVKGVLKGGWFASVPMAVISDVLMLAIGPMASVLAGLPGGAESLSKSVLKSIVAKPANLSWRGLIQVQCISHILRTAAKHVKNWLNSCAPSLSEEAKHEYVIKRIEQAVKDKRNVIPFGMNPVCRDVTVELSEEVYNGLLLFYARASKPESIAEGDWWLTMSQWTTGMPSNPPGYPAQTMLLVSDDMFVEGTTQVLHWRRDPDYVPPVVATGAHAVPSK